MRLPQVHRRICFALCLATLSLAIGMSGAETDKLAEESPAGTNTVATPPSPPVVAPPTPPSATNTPAAPPASPTSAPSGKQLATNGPSHTDYTTFKIIAERNIFNPNRSPRSRGNGASEVVRKNPKIETFSLVGVISYAKGDFAFFDGSSSSFKKVIKPEDSIAGYKVTEITQMQVKLTAEGKSLILPVGGQMRRQDEGPWELSATPVKNPPASAESVASASGDADDPPGDDAESAILKRLRMKREMESKHE